MLGRDPRADYRRVARVAPVARVALHWGRAIRGIPISGVRFLGDDSDRAIGMLIRIDESRGLERIGPVRQVRFEVLRAPLGMGFEDTLFAGDQDPQTRHMVAYQDTEPIGCLTLMPPENRSGLADRVQLRGMAVLQAWQGHGVGRQLLDHVARLAKAQGWELWCNARESAVLFYQSSGWYIVGDAFDISRIGPHFRMEWRSPR